LKHALASVLDGDDPSWSQAFELEATVAEYAWSVPDLRSIRHQTGPDKSLIFDAVVLTECRRYVLAGTKRGEISVWDGETGNPIGRLQRREAWRSLPSDQQETDPSARSWHHPILATALSPDRRTLVIAHGDYTATLWSTDNWRQIGFVEHGHFVPNVIVFSRDSSKVAITCGASRYTGSFSDWIHVVDCRSGKLLAKSDLRSWNVGDLTLSPGDEEVVVGSLDGAILRLNATTGKIVAEHPLKLESVFRAQFSPDGTRVLFVNAGDRRTRSAASTPASAIRRKAGRNPGGSWRR
jgi:WD40 repeat protein